MVRFGLAALVLAALAASPVRAQTYSSSGIYYGKGLSIWSSGPAFILDTGNQFLGEEWDLGKSYGSIDSECVLGVCAKFGVQVGAKTSGKLGVDYSLLVNSGSFDVLYPAKTSITVPTSVAVDAQGKPGVVTLGTAFTGVGSLSTGNGGPAVSTLQVTGPTLQASVRLEARLNASAGADVCVTVCVGPSFGPYNFDGSQDLLKIDSKTGSLTVLGTTVNANQNVSGLGGLVNAAIRVPDLDSSSASTPGGFSGGVLTATKRQNVAAVNANIAQIAADAVGFTFPLSGNDGSFGYNLVQSNAGVALDVAQSLSFEPAASGRLQFSAPVTPDINGVLGAPTTQISFNYGDSVSFLPGDTSSLSITPVTSLTGQLRNRTDLVVDGNISVKALGLDVAGLTLGPVVDLSLPAVSLGSIGLLDNSFSDPIDTVYGEPITLDFSCGTITGSGEFQFRQVCASSQYVDTGLAVSLFGIRIDSYSRVDCPAYSYNIAGSDPGPNCTTMFDHLGSPYLQTPDGRVDVSSAKLFGFDPLDPGASTTDGDDDALLTALGYDPGGQRFLIPAGAPLASFDVPEPGSLSLLVIGMMGVAAFHTTAAASRARRTGWISMGSERAAAQAAGRGGGVGGERHEATSARRRRMAA